MKPKKNLLVGVNEFFSRIMIILFHTYARAMFLFQVLFFPLSRWLEKLLHPYKLRYLTLLRCFLFTPRGPHGTQLCQLDIEWIIPNYGNLWINFLFASKGFIIFGHCCYQFRLFPFKIFKIDLQYNFVDIKTLL